MAWKATATVAVAFPNSLVAAVPARRGGEPESEPLLRRSLLLREVEGVLVGEAEAEGD